MYSFKSRVRYSETDEYGKLSLIAAINYMQDCSTFQSEDLGVGVDFLKSKNLAWWVNSWHICVDELPKLGEEITISTWARGFEHFYGYRNFTIQDASGAFKLKADSIWFLFDTKNKIPSRIKKENIEGYIKQSEPPLEYPIAQRKLKVEGVESSREPIAVMKHHLDTNHHVNNAIYIDMAYEAIGKSLNIKDVQASYKKAAIEGDVIYPLVYSNESGYIVRLTDGKNNDYAIVKLGENV